MFKQTPSSAAASLLARAAAVTGPPAAPRSVWAKALAPSTASICSHAGPAARSQTSLCSASSLPPAVSSRRLSTGSASRWLRNKDRPRVACSGCGVGLQSRDQAAAGYIPTLKQLEELERRADEALALSRRAAADKAAAAKPARVGGEEDEAASSAAAVSAALAAGLDLRTGTFAGHGIICQRCFQAKHYGRLVPLSLPQDAFVPYLQALKGRGALVLQVVDVFDFHSTASALVNLHKLASEHSEAASAAQEAESGSGAGNASGKPPRVDVVLVVNKVDLLPADVPMQRITTWVRDEAQRLGLGRVVPKEEAEKKKREEKRRAGRDRVGSLEVVGTAQATASGHGAAPTLAGVFLVSSKKSYGIRDVVEAVKELKGDRDVYVVGAPNVGKSTLINAILGEVWKLKPAAGAAASGGKALTSRTVFLDELPAGYTVGDVYTGDVAALDAAIRARDVGQKQAWDAEAAAGIVPALDGGVAGAAAAAAAGGYTADPAAHLRRRQAGLDARGPAAALLDTTLAEVRAKKASYASVGKQQLGVSGDSAVATPAQQPAASTGATGSGTAAPAVDVTAPDFDAASAIRSLSSTVVPAATTIPVALGGQPAASGSAPWITASGARRGAAGSAPLPFTTSPLPGTTLGVVGAPLDPHGHSYLYDTPGVIADPWKQRLLEQLVSSTSAPVTGGSAGASPPSSSAPATAKSVSGLRQLLVPDKRSPFPLVRLRPGRSLFIGGLARLDWVHPDPSVGILVHAVTRLPLHLTATHKADDLFARHALGAGAAEGVAPSAEAGAGLPLLAPSWGPIRPRGSVPLLRYAPPHVKAAMRAAGVVTEGEDTEIAAAPSQRTFGAAGAAAAVPLTHDDDDAEDARQLIVDYGVGGEDGEHEDYEEGPAARRRHALAGGRGIPVSEWRYGGSAAGTEARRRKRVRRALVDVALPGVGWLSFTPIEIEGMYGWWRALSRGSFVVHTCKGLTPHLRAPLLPHQATGTRPTDWLE